ncbi:MAG TPA: hypothetical protein VFD90_00290 [Gaiellales bacterium]|nr:hypothetical protein [Gaiellales bacterium]
MSRLGVLVLVVAAATFATVLVRTLAGEALGSDAYSHLVWARDAVRHGMTGHAAFDYTVPKPFEQGVAALGTKLGAATFVFEWTSLAGVFACAAAAAALARRLGSYPAAPLAALFALCLPVLWRGGPLGDSNVPYAALVVGAAAAGMGTPLCAALLCIAGTLRPEAWGLAVINAVLGWRKATLPTRALSVVSAVAPPALWLTLDNVFTGDWWWSSNIVDAYNDRFHPPLLHLSELPSAVIDRVGDVSTWPVALLAVAALAVGIKQRPTDAGVVFPLALVLALCIIVVRGQISADDVGRMLTALAVFAAAGAAVALAAHNAGKLRGSLAVVAVAAVPLAAAPWLLGAVHDVNDQSRQARGLAYVVAPALEREAPAGYVALPRKWQGQLALSWDRPRTTFIPARVINEEVPQCAVGALIVPANGKLPRWIREVAVTHDWRAGVRARPCTH